ncbi:RNA polymerase sigma factor SigW [Terrilactibacillus sp. BCM23-1]|uniref:RNA polymerase sigma factor SigW n=1 Tax=Terrilactibacillus tamarindi TaxID=2599694 RepID=A0A6N8CRD5_9BACI|nr:RNA polymerase sigma factor SigW [Terrilactibacillus tamarindi]MTT31495.1 RNA polymerase sigma factor SigW [Terrilactibacillus tamarindi]
MEEDINRLIKKIKKGDHLAFAEVVDMYKNGVYNICLRMVGNRQEAEDLSQEAFIRAYTKIDKYDVERKFSTWLYRIATNLSIDYLRKKKPNVYLDADLPGTEDFTLKSQLADGEPLPEESIVNSETQALIQQEINQLPLKYRSAIVLKYIQDMNLKEISEILNIPVGTVKTRIHRGREALRKRLRHVNKG